jgi:hypothetical protein
MTNAEQMVKKPMAKIAKLMDQKSMRIPVSKAPNA